MQFRFGQAIIDIIRGKQPIINNLFIYRNGNKLIYLNSKNKPIKNPFYKIKGLKLNFCGKNSTVIIHTSNKFNKCVLNIGNNNYVILKEDCNSHPYKHFPKEKVRYTGPICAQNNITCNWIKNNIEIIRIFSEDKLFSAEKYKKEI